MKKRTTTMIALLCGALIALGGATAAAAVQLKPVYPQCLRLETAILKPQQAPQFSWGLDAGGRDGAAQTAYQIMVTTPAGETVWDSGEVSSADTLDVPYSGPALAPASQFDWQVRVFDEKDKPSDWTEPQRFFTGLDDWKAQWITSPEIVAIAEEDAKRLYEEDHPARMLRTEFDLSKPVKTATLYITSLGNYRGWINGKLVSEDRLAPSATQYGYRVFYRAYDVTELLQEGSNALAVLLGDGSLTRSRVTSFGADFITRLLAQIEIEYADGSRDSVGTGSDWRSMMEKSPWQAADFDLGGIYDARLFDPAWSTAGFEDGGWRQAVVSPPVEGTRVDPETVQPCRPNHVLKPVAEYEPRPGVYVFDFGEQFTGVARFTVTLPEGHEIRLRHAQVLARDKTLDVWNYRGNSKNETVYVSAGGKSERFEGLPFHFNGSRYVEISGLPSREALEDLEVIHFADAMRAASTLDTSVPTLDGLWEIIRRAYSGNLKSGIVMDCVGRNERAPWLGDCYTSHIGVIDYFFDSIAHHRKRMQDIQDQVAYRPGKTHPGQLGMRAPSFGGAPSPFYSDAASIVSKGTQVFYDDPFILEFVYGEGPGQVRALMDFQLEQNGLSGKFTKTEPPYAFWAPWLDRKMTLPPGSGQDRWNSGDFPSRWFQRDKMPSSASQEAYGTFWWSVSAQAVADMARYLGKESEAAEYEAMAERSRQSLIRDFDNGDGTWDYHDQPIYTYGLITGAAQGELRDVFLKNLLQTVKSYGGHISGGTDVFFNTLIALSRNGYPDLAWFMAMRPEMPSFGYMIESGATAMWERFDLYHPEWGLLRNFTTADMNHVGLNSVAKWIVEDVIGLRPDPAQPGFKHFFIRPWTGSEPKEIDFQFDSPRGPIRVAWERNGDQVTLNATVPPNCSATVQWPNGKEETLGSGTHTLTGDAPLKQGEGVEGGLDEIRRYFQENPYDPEKDTNRYFEIKEAERAKEMAEAVAVTATEFTPVIFWDMETVTAEGHVGNSLSGGSGAELLLEGVVLVDDPERGKVLSFNGENALATAEGAWQGNKAVRIEMMVKNEAPAGQSVLLGVPFVFSLNKVAGFAKFQFNSVQRPDRRNNDIGIPVLQTGEWRTITAEFDPANGIARIECDGQVATLEIDRKDILRPRTQDIILGNKLNAFFKGQIDDIRISVMD
ncbi:alpha-L-rhamnosidase [Kiritimatiella glycovorans]|uniref:alpha-L-rhamnosidase n=1 Tax=Kiritimatiella glycovorans TaxID=1307763 RepID=A0A0G3EFI7_9BACT|nr:alpha-L-rhamnosidase [Kiritimatiella glycovorans]AKJ64167.1 Alpha-L-rhamnosidase [Kiritimatiella glycovorans]